MKTNSFYERLDGKTCASRLLLGGALAGLLLLAHSAHAQEGLVVEQLPGRTFSADDGTAPLPAARRNANPAWRLPNARPVSSYALRQVLRLEVYRAAPPQARQPQRRRLSPSERAALRRDLLRTYENESFVVHVSPRPRDEDQSRR